MYVSTSPSYIISQNTSKINLPKLARPTHKPNGVLRNLYWPLCFINYVYLVLPFGTWKNPFSSRLLSIFLIAIICLSIFYDVYLFNFENWTIFLGQQFQWTAIIRFDLVEYHTFIISFDLQRLAFLLVSDLDKPDHHLVFFNYVCWCRLGTSHSVPVSMWIDPLSIIIVFRRCRVYSYVVWSLLRPEFYSLFSETHNYQPSWIVRSPTPLELFRLLGLAERSSWNKIFTGNQLIRSVIRSMHLQYF